MRMPLCFALIALGMGVAHAQVGIVDDPKARMESLLNSLHEVQPEHFLDVTYGVYAKRKQIGKVEVSVGGTSSYDVLLKSKIALGATRTSSSETLELAPNFALQRKTKRETVDGGVSVGSEEARTFSEGEWQFRRTADGQERVGKLTASALHHDEFPCLLLLVRSLDLGLRASYTLESVGWDQAKPEQLAVQPLDLRVEPGVEFSHRSQTKRGARVHVSRGGVGVFVFQISKGTVLEVEFLGTPLRLVHGTPRQVLRDLPLAAGEASDRSPKQAVVVYLRAMFTGEAEALDSVCDWEALRQDEAESEPWVAESTTEAFAESVKSTVRQLSQGSEVPEFALEFLGAGITEAIDGESAVVSMQGEATVFELERRDGTWWIVKRP